MTQIVESGRTQRMGRPPLKRNAETVVTTIRITADVAAQIDAIAGPNKRGEWIRDAITRELRRVKSSTRHGSAKSPDAE